MVSGCTSTPLDGDVSRHPLTDMHILDSGIDALRASVRQIQPDAPRTQDGREAVIDSASDRRADNSRTAADGRDNLGNGNASENTSALATPIAATATMSPLPTAGVMVSPVPLGHRCGLEGSEFVFAFSNDTPSGLRNFVPGSLEVAQWFGNDQPSLVAQGLQDGYLRVQLA